jgi:hypothetical protein
VPLALRPRAADVLRGAGIVQLPFLLLGGDVLGGLALLLGTSLVSVHAAGVTGVAAGETSTVTTVDAVISPEPPEDEREALLAVLDEASPETADGGAWRRAALREGTSPGDP